MIPGQIRYPRQRKEARAIPVGGQTALALLFTEARLSPKTPAAT